MQLDVPVDVADAIRSALSALGFEAVCRPLPRELSQRLPITLVEAMPGGTREAVVVDRRPVRLTTWAETPGEAIEVASQAMAGLLALQRSGGDLAGSPVYRVRPTDAPYEAADPAHPDIPRAIQTMVVWVRAQTQET